MNTNSEHILSFYIVLFIQFLVSFGVTTHSSSGRRIRTLRPIAREERTKMDERKILKSLFSPHFHFYVFSLRRFSNENFEQTFSAWNFLLRIWHSWRARAKQRATTRAGVGRWRQTKQMRKNILSPFSRFSDFSHRIHRMVVVACEIDCKRNAWMNSTRWVWQIYWCEPNSTKTKSIYIFIFVFLAWICISRSMRVIHKSVYSQLSLRPRALRINERHPMIALICGSKSGWSDCVEITFLHEELRS